MKHLISLPLILCLVSVVGCAPVAANFPKSKAPVEKELPEQYHHDNKSSRLVMREAGAAHAFFIFGNSSASMVALMNKYAAMGNQEAANDAVRFEKMAKLKTAYVKVHIFVAKDVKEIIKRGDFLISFTDGSSVQDSGSLLYPLRGSRNPSPRATWNSTVILSGESDPKMKGRSLYLFYPAEHQEKTISSIAITSLKNSNLQ